MLPVGKVAKIGKVAEQIGAGHAFAKHVLQHGDIRNGGGGEFVGLGIRTVKQFQGFIDNIMNSASGSNVRSLSNGRTAYWDDATGTVVIHHPRAPDAGTAFRPRNGRAYFDGLQCGCMRVDSTNRDSANVELSKGELTIINNALNEVCHGLDVWDFDIRMGVAKPEVLKLLHRVSELLQRME